MDGDKNEHNEIAVDPMMMNHVKKRTQKEDGDVDFGAALNMFQDMYFNASQMEGDMRKEYAAQVALAFDALLGSEDESDD